VEREKNTVYADADFKLSAECLDCVAQSAEKHVVGSLEFRYGRLIYLERGGEVFLSY
jgi:hypothetical protein